MGRRATRRALTRRSLPPRPGEDHEERGLSVSTAANRPRRLVEREAPYLMDELKRVAMVTTTCIGLLIFLTVIDRMR